jgi:membrane protein YdbS with pleckstrin-like domain
MGTSAETAIIDYCLSFADQGKQISIFSVFVCSKQMDLLCSVGFVFLYIYVAVVSICTVYEYIFCHFKWKKEAQAIPYRLLIVQTEVCRLSVCRQRNKRKLFV